MAVSYEARAVNSSERQHMVCTQIAALCSCSTNPRPASCTHFAKKQTAPTDLTSFRILRLTRTEIFSGGLRETPPMARALRSNSRLSTPGISRAGAVRTSKSPLDGAASLFKEMYELTNGQL